MGVRGLGTAVVYLDDVFVPEENLLGVEGKGFDVLLEASALSVLALVCKPWSSPGSPEYFAGLCRATESNGKTHHQTYDNSVASGRNGHTDRSYRWLAYHAAFMLDQGKDIKCESAMVKLFASQAAVEVTRMGMQITGAYGAIENYAH